MTGGLGSRGGGVGFKGGGVTTTEILRGDRDTLVQRLNHLSKALQEHGEQLRRGRTTDDHRVALWTPRTATRGTVAATPANHHGPAKSNSPRAARSKGEETGKALPAAQQDPDRLVTQPYTRRREATRLRTTETELRAETDGLPEELKADNQRDVVTSLHA